MKRLEGLAKLTGKEPYLDDIPLADVLHAQVVRSPAPRGRVRAVRYGAGVDWSEIVTLEARDLDALGVKNSIRTVGDAQPILADEEVRHVHEPVVLLAHPSRAVLRRAAAAIEIEIEPRKAFFDFRRAPEGEEVDLEGDLGEDNVFTHLTITKGDGEKPSDFEAVFAAAPHVVEGVYETGGQEHVYLEPQAMAAGLDGDVLVVQGSMQCPYYVVAALEHALGLPRERIRVVQTSTGGGFGGKEEYPSNLALYTSLLALKSGRPVKLLYDRGEDMAVTTKRHPSWIRHRTAVSDEGVLLAQEIEVRLDAGAYQTLSPVVLSRSVLHAAGPYDCEHVRIDGKAIRTHRVPSGAFRGFGAPQSHFANERHMDVIALRLGLDPAELRRRNLLRDGRTTSTGQVVRDGVDLRRLLDRALEESDWTAKKAAHAAFNRGEDPATRHLRRGIGLASFHHGAGFTGSGEVYLASVVEVLGHADGTVEVLASSTEMGQGTITAFTRIAAARLGCDPSGVIIARPDTSRVPDSGPTVASRTVMVVGKLVERACDDLRARLTADLGADPPIDQALKKWHAEHPGGELRGRAQYEAPPGILWDDKTYRGDAYPTFGWAAYVAEVEVDLRTFTARVIDFVAVQDVGRVIHTTLARGQVQGGVAQAIGWALLEEIRERDGAMINNQLTNYIIPTSDDVPPIRVVFLETPYEYGGLGAKGLGELPMDGPAPAILNAVADATGTDPRTVPLTPERLFSLLGDSP